MIRAIDIDFRAMADQMSSKMKPFDKAIADVSKISKALSTAMTIINVIVGASSIIRAQYFAVRTDHAGGAMCNLHFRAIFIVLLLLTTMHAAIAKVQKEECALVRTRAENSGDQLFFQKGKDFFSFNGNKSLLADAIKSNKPSNGYRIRFVFLTPSNTDDRPPTFSIIQRFLTGYKSNGEVNTYNNVRRHNLRIALDDYQKFHKQGDTGSAYRDLTEWFHVGPGWFTHRDFVDTKRWRRPREFLAIGEDRVDGEEIRSYLIVMQDVRPDGSCLDFTPLVSPTSKRISITIRDLRESETGEYFDPYQATLEISQ